MNTRYEDQLLERIFSDDEYEDGFPLVEPPQHLSQRLYALADEQQQLRWFSWRRGAVVAASVAVFAFVFHFGVGRDKPISEVEQARRDLHLAFSYLNKANQRVENNVLSTLRVNMQKATLVPVLSIQLERKS